MVDHEDHGNTSNDSTNGEIKAPNALRLKKTLTNDEILSQAITFLFAGFDTVERSLSFITYNLAINPEYQEELCEEIDNILEKYVIEIILLFFIST
jgi:cytochrome P450